MWTYTFITTVLLFAAREETGPRIERVLILAMFQTFDRECNFHLETRERGWREFASRSSAIPCQLEVFNTYPNLRYFVYYI
jgi:hypothetical protein